MDDSGADPGPEPRPQAWRDAIGGDERKRRRRPADQRATLRRVTVSAAVAAAGLNVVLFAQTGLEQSGPGAVQDAIISAVAGLFPRGGLQPPAQAPTPAPGTNPIATTGGS
ncbi:MAG TPA: hypothetical protein VLU92_02790 [Candidatus Dormibacteraeota bacterium]|nr:hypothetical protein [Candidatus Dormibacteraeota bacterium]